MKESNKFYIFCIMILASCLLLPASAFAQVDTSWVRRYNGPGNLSDWANAITVDSIGNVYVTGWSYGSGNPSDYATIKYNSAGNQQWVALYNGPANDEDYAYEIVLDSSGNIYVTGKSTGSSTGSDYATIKYNSAGIEQWIARYNGPGNDLDEVSGIAVDRSSNVYVTGRSWSFNTYFDYATIKYDSMGIQKWAIRYNGPENYWDEAYAIAVDNLGNVYVTGKSDSSDTYGDYVTIKYNSDGVQQWLARYNGLLNGDDYAIAIATDNSGNVYVTGSSQGFGSDYDYVTIKYNSSGVQQWVARYNGSSDTTDYAMKLTVDVLGNVYVVGNSFDSISSWDYTTVKYNSAGIQQWVRRYNRTGNAGDWATAITVDAAGNAYVTGCSENDYVTIKYNSAGIQEWVAIYNGPENYGDAAEAIAIDNSGNIYVTGGSYGFNSYYDYATIKYVQTGAVAGERSTLDAIGNTLEVYPNPVRNYFVIRPPLSTARFTLRMYDVSGKLVKELQGLGVEKFKVSLKGISPGIYFLQLDNSPTTKKLVITK